MQAVVSLLEATAYSRIEAMWRVLELKCGLRGIKNTPFPHFSWHVAEGYDPALVSEAIESMVGPSRPFTVQTSGLGIFTGQEPVIYLLISKTEKLLRFHKALWRRIDPLARGSSAYYAPDIWVPHITLAHGDVNKQSLLCALEELAFIPFNWEIKIDNLAVVGQSGEEVGHLVSRYDFPDRRRVRSED
jgi:2'-5' RNA ligase